jgi:CHAT domain-containing protein/Tfp pilus assembly protein PilF
MCDIKMQNAKCKIYHQQKLWPSLSHAFLLLLLFNAFPAQAKTIESQGIENDRILQQETSLNRIAQISYTKTEAIRLLQLGDKQFSANKYQDAIVTFQSVLAIWQKIGNRGAQGDALHKLGQTYEALGKYRESLESYRRAVKIFLDLHEKENAAGSLSGLGIVYLQTGEYYQAIEVCKKSLELFPDGMVALSNLGLAYSYLGQYEKALGFHQQVLSIRRERHARTSIAVSLTNIGVIYNHLFRHDEAFRAYQEASTIFKKSAHYMGQAISLNGMGETHNNLGQYSKALKFFEESLKIAKRANSPKIQGNILGNIGMTYSHLNQDSEALQFYEKALFVHQTINNREGEARTLANIGELFHKQGQIELSIVFLKQSVDGYESIREKSKPLPSDLQESYTQSVAATYRRLADLLISQGRIGEAQQVLERLKIQELNDFSKGTRAPTPIAKGRLNSVETQIKQKYTSLIAFGGKFYECEKPQQRCPEYRVLKNQYDSLSKEFQTFAQLIKRQLRDGRLEEVSKVTQDFQNSADRIVTAHPNSILIYPLVLRDKTRLLFAAKGGVLSKTAICSLGEAALYSKVSQFQTLLSKRGDETKLKAIGKDLYDCLIKPLEPEFAAAAQAKRPIQHLIFVPDRATNYIPMGSLFDGNQYLIERFAISNVLSAGLTDTDDTLKSPEQTPILALGLSRATGRFNALPNVEAELNAIVSQTDHSNSAQGIYPGQIFLNQKFTKTALEDNIRGHRIIHIATHGEFMPENPHDSYFLLGTGTPYPIPDVQALRDLKEVHLVVLSACETGLGGVDSLGLQMTGISSFFMGDRDRAKAVLASLWNVNDTSTALMMQQFYKHLATGKLTKVAALRQVQLSLLHGQLTAQNSPQNGVTGRSGEVEITVTGTPNMRALSPPDFTHPYYWAPFILIGNGL